MRDDFPKPVVVTLAKRVGDRCSNPACRKRTSGPHTDDDKALNVGVAESGKKIAGWVKDRLWDFHKIDKMAALFRYADPPEDGELWIDFHQLQVVIDKLVQAIEQYMRTRTKVDTRGLV